MVVMPVDKSDVHVVIAHQLLSAPDSRESTADDDYAFCWHCLRHSGSFIAVLTENLNPNIARSTQALSASATSRA